MVFICLLCVQDSMYLLLVSLREVHRCHPGSLLTCARPSPSFSPWAAAFEISEFYRAAEASLCCRLSCGPQGHSVTGRSSMFIWRGWGARQVRWSPQEWWVERCSLMDRRKFLGTKGILPINRRHTINDECINQVLNEFSLPPSLFSLSLFFILSFPSFFFIPTFSRCVQLFWWKYSASQGACKARTRTHFSMWTPQAAISSNSQIRMRRVFRNFINSSILLGGIGISNGCF